MLSIFSKKVKTAQLYLYDRKFPFRSDNISPPEQFSPSFYPLPDHPLILPATPPPDTAPVLSGVLQVCYPFFFFFAALPFPPPAALTIATLFTTPRGLSHTNPPPASAISSHLTPSEFPDDLISFRGRKRKKIRDVFRDQLSFQGFFPTSPSPPLLFSSHSHLTPLWPSPCGLHTQTG